MDDILLEAFRQQACATKAQQVDISGNGDHCEDTIKMVMQQNYDAANSELTENDLMGMI